MIPKPPGEAFAQNLQQCPRVLFLSVLRPRVFAPSDLLLCARACGIPLSVAPFSGAVSLSGRVRVFRVCVPALPSLLVLPPCVGSSLPFAPFSGAVSLSGFVPPSRLLSPKPSARLRLPLRHPLTLRLAPPPLPAPACYSWQSPPPHLHPHHLHPLQPRPPLRRCFPRLPC